jgi:hypothetical protein
MSTFTIRIELERKKAQNRAEDIAIRATIQRALLAVISQVSNCGRLQGEIHHDGAVGTFQIEEIKHV